MSRPLSVHCLLATRTATCHTQTLSKTHEVLCSEYGILHRFLGVAGVMVLRQRELDTDSTTIKEVVGVIREVVRERIPNA
jgi:hypothetical protein